MLSAQIAERELIIAAYKANEAGLKDATKAEIVKFSFLVAAGYQPQRAADMVLELRNRPNSLDGKSVLSVKIPEEWAETAETNLPGLSQSQLFRYCILRLSTSHEEALMMATEPKRGRPRKSQ